MGVVAGLEALAAHGDTAPLLLRLSDPAAAECIAGVWEPAAAIRLRSQLCRARGMARDGVRGAWGSSGVTGGWTTRWQAARLEFMTNPE